MEKQSHKLNKTLMGANAQVDNKCHFFLAHKGELLRTCNMQKRGTSVMLPTVVHPCPLKKMALFQAFMSSSESDFSTGAVDAQGTGDLVAQRKARLQVHVQAGWLHVAAVSFH